MSSFIYTLYRKADPGNGWVLNDPIFDGPAPTLGACVPNIRNSVALGDWVFSISGRVANEQQFVIGGFRVAEKIEHLAAYSRFPEYRLDRTPEGQMIGNVIVTQDGSQHPSDRHSHFQRRIKNYLVGDEAIYLKDTNQYNVARKETIPFLSQLFNRSGNRVFDLIGRHRKLTPDQAAQIRDWLADVQTRS